MLSVTPALICGSRHELKFFVEFNQSTVELYVFVNELTQYSRFQLSLQINRSH